MKTIALIGLAALAGAVLWKHSHGVDVSLELRASPTGVPSYSPVLAPQRLDQIRAALPTNPDAVSTPGFAPAFGSGENQVNDWEMEY